jgi:hypothetical protein
MTQRTPTISIDARTNRPNAVTGFAYSSMGCGHAGCGKTPHTSTYGAKTWRPAPSCGSSTATGRNASPSSRSDTAPSCAARQQPTALEEVAQLAGSRRVTLLTASRDLAHSEAAVLAKRLRTMIERRTRSASAPTRPD